VLGLLLTIAGMILCFYIGNIWLLLLLFLPWLPFFGKWRWAGKLATGVVRGIRIADHDKSELRRVLLKFTRGDLEGQPIGGLSGDAPRLELLKSFLAVSKELSFSGLVVIVDQVDEPTRVKSNPDQIGRLIGPVLDLRLLGHEDIGIKLLLPKEAEYPLSKELEHARSRLDKQRYLPSLEWSGVMLADLIDTRLKAYTVPVKKPPKWRDLLDDAISDREFKDSLGNLEVPRFAFMLMWNMIAGHCSLHPLDEPVWKIGRDTFVKVREEMNRQKERYRQNRPIA
jgi:hypothetical protein